MTFCNGKLVISTNRIVLFSSTWIFSLFKLIVLVLRTTTYYFSLKPKPHRTHLLHIVAVTLVRPPPGFRCVSEAFCLQDFVNLLILVISPLFMCF